jgi:hypothetical protein
MLCLKRNEAQSMQAAGSVVSRLLERMSWLAIFVSGKNDSPGLFGFTSSHTSHMRSTQVSLAWIEPMVRSSVLQHRNRIEFWSIVPLVSIEVSTTCPVICHVHTPTSAMRNIDQRSCSSAASSPIHSLFQVNYRSWSLHLHVAWVNVRYAPK